MSETNVVCKANDEDFMRRALALAETGVSVTPPNPSVGALIVKDGIVLASGRTQRAGGPHAEVMALREAMAKNVETQGATLYVTLEPCAHYGRTPPCALAVRAAGFARVVVAMLDPNPLVSGKGCEMVREAGIEVSGPLLQEEAFWLNRGFFTRMQTGRPWVRLKSAATLDGRTAFEDGRSQWITGPAAREDNQRARARAGAIVTGVGTVLADDPSLNVRLAGAERQPIRVVVDSRMRTPPSAKLFSLPGEVWVVAAREDEARRRALERAGAKVFVMTGEDGRTDLRALLRALADVQVNEVHLEAGAALSGSFMAAELVDEILLYQAPCFFGGGRGIADVPRPVSPGGAERWRVRETALVGADLKTVLTRSDAQ